MTSKNITIRNFRTELAGEIRDNAWYFPTATATNKLGKVITWTIYVKCIKIPYSKFPCADITEDMFLPLDDALFDNKPLPALVCGYIRVKSQIGDGKIRDNVPDIVEVGKSLKTKASTNTFCQALRDAYSKYLKQTSKSNSSIGVSSSINTTVKLFPPMLAQIYSKQKKEVPFPVYVQRKYNGVRAVMVVDNGEILMYSRKLKPYFGFPKIRAEALKIIKSLDLGDSKEPLNLYLDGELYAHGVPLQTISGLARRESNDVAIENKVQFMVYDCFTDNNALKFTERMELLRTLFTANYEHCILTETLTVKTDEAVKKLYAEFLTEGYEGAMVRTDALYDFAYNDRHSKVLLKIKETFDAEYEITNWGTGDRGKAVNALMMTCKINDKTFNITPAMTLEDRIALATKMAQTEVNGKTHFENNYLGKMLIVEFDEKSIDGVPQRARTKMEVRTWD
jgi:ATP-dependent DNA ligase